MIFFLLMLELTLNAVVIETTGVLVFVGFLQISVSFVSVSVTEVVVGGQIGFCGRLTF